jgi:hypothetical protein
MVSLVSPRPTPFLSIIHARPVPWLTRTHNSDIAFYGVNLNQSIVLSKIGFGKADTPWGTLWNTAVGNIIVSSAVSREHTLSRRVVILQTQLSSDTPA